MKCSVCKKNMKKIDRRDEMAELDDDATDGQFADYFASELSGDNGAWNIGVIEYLCTACKIDIELISDELPSYDSLIAGWHEKASEGDCFSRFIFQYLAFIAHVKNNLFYRASTDREAIQMLKRDEGIKARYLVRIHSDPALVEAWGALIEELNRKPLYNSSYDPDFPEIDAWWNSIENRPDASNTPKGIVHSLDDWSNMVEFWCGVRNNLFHGGKHPSVKRDLFLVLHAYLTLRPLMYSEIAFHQIG